MIVRLVKCSNMSDKVNSRKPVPLGQALPKSDELTGIGQLPRSINHEHGLAANPHVARVVKRFNEGIKVLLIVRTSRIGLFNQYAFWGAVPNARPAFVGPPQAEWKIWFPEAQHLVERPLQDTFAGKPIMPIAETLNPCPSSQGGLCLPCLRQSQVVKPKVRR